MPRKPRMYRAGVPCHVIQRGNNRKDCFFTDQDRLVYLEWLKDACVRFDVAVHAYVLMTNHVHLLLTPDDEVGISRVIQSLGRRYVQYINFGHQRSGTLWEGRHKSSLIEAETYLIACYRYIELNPVRASMVADPVDYRWSSHRYNAGIHTDPLISEHDLYTCMGGDRNERARRYRALFQTPLDPTQISTIRLGAQFSMPTGGRNFRKQIESRLGRSFG